MKSPSPLVIIHKIKKKMQQFIYPFPKLVEVSCENITIKYARNPYQLKKCGTGGSPKDKFMWGYGLPMVKNLLPIFYIWRICIADEEP